MRKTQPTNSSLRLLGLDVLFQFLNTAWNSGFFGGQDSQKGLKGMVDETTFLELLGEDIDLLPLAFLL